MKATAAPFNPTMVPISMIRPGMMIPAQPGQMVPMIPVQPGQVMPMQPGQPVQPGQMMSGVTFIPMSYPMMRPPMQYPINPNQMYPAMTPYPPRAQSNGAETNVGKWCVCWNERDSACGKKRVGTLFTL